MISYELAIVLLLLLIVTFLLFREIACWYWKVNERTALLRDIRAELRKLNQTEKGGADQALLFPPDTRLNEGPTEQPSRQAKT
jgi:hypothetical protein